MTVVVVFRRISFFCRLLFFAFFLVFLFVRLFLHYIVTPFFPRWVAVFFCAAGVFCHCLFSPALALRDCVNPLLVFCHGKITVAKMGGNTEAERDSENSQRERGKDNEERKKEREGEGDNPMRPTNGSLLTFRPI